MRQAQRSHRFVELAALACIFAMLAACASLEKPKSFSDRLAYGYAAVTAVRDTAAGLLERKRITKDDARQAQALADQARAGLDLASSARGAGDLGNAEAQLELALEVVMKVEAHLRAREAR